MTHTPVPIKTDWTEEMAVTNTTTIKIKFDTNDSDTMLLAARDAMVQLVNTLSKQNFDDENKQTHTDAAVDRMSEVSSMLDEIIDCY